MINNIKTIWKRVCDKLEHRQRDDLIRIVYDKGIDRDYHPLCLEIAKLNSPISYDSFIKIVFWMREFLDTFTKSTNYIAIDMDWDNGEFTIYSTKGKFYFLTHILSDIAKSLKQACKSTFIEGDDFEFTAPYPKKDALHWGDNVLSFMQNTFAWESLEVEDDFTQAYTIYYAKFNKIIRKAARRYRFKELADRWRYYYYMDYSNTITIHPSNGIMMSQESVEIRNSIIKELNALRNIGKYYLITGNKTPFHEIEIIDLKFNGLFNYICTVRERDNLSEVWDTPKAEIQLEKSRLFEIKDHISNTQDLMKNLYYLKLNIINYFQLNWAIYN